MSEEKEFISSPISPQNGSVIWEAPSNIALVKYWGKYGNQLPQNPSLSFTLSSCSTTTKLVYSERENHSDAFSFSFEFEGKKQASFHQKIEQFFARILPYCPYVKTHHFAISSSNSFPHSSGIASSASSMCALALCIVSLEKNANPSMSDAFFLQKASFLARLGSGSAARSVQGPLMSWGHSTAIAGSSPLFGTQITQDIHPIFHDFQDSILIIDKGQKKVSSTLGHQLMENHPYAQTRFTQAEENLLKLTEVLKKGDLDTFISIVESEALTLHALMMASSPYFILMKPETLSVLNAIWDFRQQTNIPVCFTLDAGANVHVLYPKANSVQVLEFIETNLKRFCENGQYIEDQVGSGAIKH